MSATAAADGPQSPPPGAGRTGLGLTGTALTGLALSRAVVDRSAHLRADAAWLAAAWSINVLAAIDKRESPNRYQSAACVSATAAII